MVRASLNSAPASLARMCARACTHTHTHSLFCSLLKFSLWVWSLQVSETLKRFAGKVTTASVKERREILGELGKCVAGKGIYFPSM